MPCLQNEETDIMEPLIMSIYLPVLVILDLLLGRTLRIQVHMCIFSPTELLIPTSIIKMEAGATR